MILTLAFINIFLALASGQLSNGAPSTPFFSLFFGTQQPTQAPVAVGGFDINCKDKLDNCNSFGKTSCKAPYAEWAQDYCPQYCGFCVGPTTPPPPCEDNINDCHLYGSNICSDVKYAPWVQENCRYYCRQCTAAQLMIADSKTTTVSPASCVDKVECKNYGKQACTNFKEWAQDNCMNYCGFCVGVPTPPAACVDKIPNCKAYQGTACTDSKYRPWAEENCRQHCNFCTGSGGNAVPALPAVPTMMPGKRAVPVKRQDFHPQPPGSDASHGGPIPYIPPKKPEPPTTTTTTTPGPTTTPEPTTTQAPTTQAPTTPAPTTTPKPTTQKPRLVCDPLPLVPGSGPRENESGYKPIVAPTVSCHYETIPPVVTDAPTTMSPAVTTDNGNMNGTDNGNNGTDNGNTTGTDNGNNGTDTGGNTSVDMTTMSPGTDSQVNVTDAPATNPPATNAPVTNPPATNASGTNPPATNAPATNPPATNAPGTNPPATSAPGTNPPVTNAPTTNAPDTNPPVTNAPVTNPPDTNAPDTNPPATNAPGTNPPATNAPTTNAPGTDGSASMMPSALPCGSGPDSCTPAPNMNNTGNTNSTSGNGSGDMTTEMPASTKGSPAVPTKTPVDVTDAPPTPGQSGSSPAMPSIVSTDAVATNPTSDGMTTVPMIPTKPSVDMASSSALPPKVPTKKPATTNGGMASMVTVTSMMSTPAASPGAPTKMPTVSVTDVVSVPAASSGPVTMAPSGNPGTAPPAGGSSQATTAQVPTKMPASTVAPTDSPVVPTKRPDTSAPVGTTSSSQSVNSGQPVVTGSGPGSGTIIPGGNTVVPGTGEPDLNATSNYNVSDVCEDDPATDCRLYDFQRICTPDSVYHPWATVHCRATCGFCIASTTVLPCVDEITNCDEYEDGLCTRRFFLLFREKNCRKFCKLCTP